MALLTCLDDTYPCFDFNHWHFSDLTVLHLSMTPALDVLERNNAIIIIIVVFSSGFHTHVPGFIYPCGIELNWKMKRVTFYKRCID